MKGTTPNSSNGPAKPIIDYAGPRSHGVVAEPVEPASPKPILDYASPRSHGKLRLPSRSILEWHWSDAAGERDLVVTEKLRGRAGAIVALVFALFILFLLAAEMRAFFLWPSHGEGVSVAVVGILGLVW